MCPRVRFAIASTAWGHDAPLLGPGLRRGDGMVDFTLVVVDVTLVIPAEAGI